MEFEKGTVQSAGLPQAPMLLGELTLVLKLTGILMSWYRSFTRTQKKVKEKHPQYSTFPILCEF